jgi:hypothetical protein
MDTTTTTNQTTRPAVIEGTTRWNVPGHYGPGPDFATFDEAVAHARSEQVILSNGQASRMFVDLRQMRTVPAHTVDIHGTGWGLDVAESKEDAVMMRFEVYPDHIETVR